MKKAILVLCAGLLILVSCNKVSKIQLKTESDSASYALGVKIGENFKQIKEQFPDISYDILLSAIKQMVSEQKPQIEPKAAEQIVMTFGQKQQAKMLGKNAKDEKEFLEKNKSKSGVTTLPSGVQYEVLTQGTGASPVKMEDTVVVHYKGTFLDGKVFDSSIDRGTPWESPLTSTIRGWQEVLPMMKAGSKYKIYVPSALAYGERMMNKMLVFEIELINVKFAKESKKAK